jgi:competence protein ComEC
MIFFDKALNGTLHQNISLVSEKLRALFMFERQLPLYWFPVFLGMGISAYFALRFEPSILLSAPLFAFLVVLLTFLWPFKNTDEFRFKALFMTILMLTIFTMGFCAAQLRTAIVTAPVIAQKIGPVDVQGQIVNIDRLEDGKGLRLVLGNLKIEKLKAEDTPYNIRLTVRQHGAYKIGQTIHVLASLNPPSPPVSPSAFDFQRFSFFKKIGAFGFTFAAPEIISEAEKAQSDRLNTKLEIYRQKIADKVFDHIEGRNASILIALMTGERAGISQEDWEAMRVSGLAHMLAISGLHVGMVAAVVFGALRMFMVVIPGFALRYPAKKYAAFGALVCAFLYMLIVGSTVPTMRAMIMTGIVLLAIMFDRQPFSLRLVTIAAFILLLFFPESLLGASFQMSFAAVVCLIFCYEQLRPHMQKLYSNAGWGRRFGLYFVGVSLTTIIASIATGPLSVFHFQQFANYSLLSNLLTVPILGIVIMPAIVIAYPLMALGMDGPILWLSGKGIGWILWVAHETTNLPFSSWSPPQVPSVAFYMSMIGMIFMIFWQGPFRWAGLLPLCIGLYWVVSMERPFLYVSSSGKLAAINVAEGFSDSDHFIVTSRVSDRFVTKNWMRHNGLEGMKPEIMKSSSLVACDEYACRYEKETAAGGMMKISISTHAASHKDDCEWADIVFSKVPVYRAECRKTQIIDLFNTRENGGYIVFEDGASLSVQDVRGTRPWTVTNRR